jgi:hypothetical protein
MENVDLHAARQAVITWLDEPDKCSQSAAG